MPSASGDVRLEGALPPGVKPDPGWGREFSERTGFAVRAAGVLKAYVFMNQRLAGDKLSRTEAAKSSFTMAHIVASNPDVDWHVEAEPIGGGTMGLILYNAKKKPLMAGTYSASTGRIALKTLYSNITNVCKNKAAVKITYKSGDTEVSGEYSAEWQ